MAKKFFLSSNLPTQFKFLLLTGWGLTKADEDDLLITALYKFQWPGL